MNAKFAFTVSESHAEIVLETDDGPFPADRWALDAPSSLIAGVDLARRLEAAGVAIIENETLLVEHRAVAGLTAGEAGCLGLPPAADVVAYIQPHGLMTRPGYRVELIWKRSTGASPRRWPS